MAAEVGVAAASNIVSEAAKSLFQLIKREISYVFKYQSYIDGLKKQVEEVGYRREMVEQPVNHAKQQGDEIYKGVEDWLNSIDDFTEKVAKPTTGGEEEAKRRCFKGLCPNLFKRYNLSKKAVKAVKEGADLLGRGNFSTVSYRPAGDLERQVKELEFLRQRVEKDVERAERQGEEIFEDVKGWLIRVKDFNDKAVNAAEEAGNLLRKGNFSNVSYRPVLENREFMQVRGYEQFDSRMKVFQDVMVVLNDSNVDMIGVYGMGGVGKTTLVKQVARKVMEEKLFDEVIMAEVTQTPDHKIIQDKLARDLGLEFGQQESVFHRADQLRLRLKKEKRVLIILDNIWTKLELDAVGIPFWNGENQRKDDKRRCTIILTSRSRDLLSNGMNSQKNFPIEVLSKEEAEQLFEKTVGNSENQSDFQPIADEIVGRCGGLPVALNTIAKALKNKSLPIWKDAVDQLRSSNMREIHGMDANVYSSIELSYKFLESDEAKSLFLLCCLHDAGHSIHIPYLVRYGLGLGLFKNVHTLEAARNRVHRLIDNLKASCLLLDGDTEDDVKMHDIIHDVAVSIASTKLMINIQDVGDLKDEIEKTMLKDPIAVSLPFRDVCELPEHLECPKLKLFLLYTKSGYSLQIPDLFFEGMKQLKVLDFTKICFPSLPSSLGCLVSLQTLCLEACQLEDITLVGQLKKLEILSFRSSDIEKLPEEIGRLTRLRLLDLSDCKGLTVIAPNVIAKFSQLEELYMVNSFIRWEKVEGGSNACLVELKGLLKLTTLHIHIQDIQIMSQNLVSVELERYRIIVGNVRGWSFSKTSRFMKLYGLKKCILLGHGMKMLLKRSEDLCLEELNGYQNVVPELDDEEVFPRLQHLHIKDCLEILHIVGSVAGVHCKVFPLLESLFLYNLINLEDVCHSQLSEDQSFSKLKIIKVKGCDRLKHLFSFSMAKNLQRIQEIEVTDCQNLEMIVGPDLENPITTSRSKEIIAEDDLDEKVIFPSLERLTVQKCKRVEYLFSFYTVKSLVLLQYLEVKSCESMKSIFDTTRLGRDEAKLIIEMVFPKLHYLKLSWLPKLTSFAMGIHSIAFPSLFCLELYSCHNFRRFIPMSSSEEIIDTETQNLFDGKVFFFPGGIIDTETRPFFDEKVGLPSLEILKIKGMSSLTKIWHHQLASDSFSKLKILQICNCKMISNIFPANIIMGGRLDHLECLEVFNCYSVEEIIEETSFNCNNFMVEEEVLRRFVFPRLTSLELWYLPNLKSFFLGKHISEWPVLESLKVVGCHKVETLFGSPEYLNQESRQPMFLLDQKVAFPNLMTLDVSLCDQLRSLVTLSIAQSLVRIASMTITDCKIIEKIIQVRGWEEVKEENHVVFRQLKKLVLDCLESLTSFCEGNYTLEFPFLEQVYVRQCLNMKTFSQGILHTPKLHKVQLTYIDDDDEGCWEGNLNSTLQKVFEEMVGFRNIRHLKLSEFIPLKEIWHSQALPVSFFCSLRELTVDDCPFMSSAIPVNLLQYLGNLKTLEVRNCELLEEVFYLEELNADEHSGPLFPKLEELKLIDLSKLKRFCNFTGNIIKLPSLLHLTIKDCPVMETFISNSTHVPKESQEVTLEDNFLANDTKSLFDEKVIFPRLEKLIVEYCENLKYMFSFSTVNSLGQLQHLEIKTCESMKGVVDTTGLGRDEQKLIEFPSLLHLELCSCRNLRRFIPMSSSEEIIHTETLPLFDEKIGLPSLEILKFEWMSNLRKIWHHQLASDSFSKLKNLEIKNCEMISNIFPANFIMRSRLASLECLEVFDCYSVEEIIEETSFNCNDFMVKEELLRRFVFPRLTSLELWYLPNLKSFFLGKHISEWPVLENLKVVGCHKVETLFGSPEYLSQKSRQPMLLLDQKVAFPYLMTLDVSLCDQLRSLATLSTAQSLVRLATMTITDCKIIEKIIQVQAGEEVEEDLVFNQLENLVLECLESLTSFCQGNYTLDFPSLKRVYVRECLNMKTFSQGVLHTPNLHKVQLTYNHDEGCWEGNLNSTLQKVFKEMVGFNNILHLKLSQFPYLKEIWHGQALPISLFRNLRDLVVDDCTFMSSAIPANLLRFLNNLKFLEVRNCDSLEEVFHLEELNADEHFGPLFPELEELKLIDLSKLKRFCNFTGNIIELPSLLHLIIENCPIMETFIFSSTPVPKEPQEMASEENFLVADIQHLFDEKVSFARLEELKLFRLPMLAQLWKENSQPSEGFQNLKTLRVSECNKLEKLVPSSVSFQNLMTLEVSKCEGLINMVALSTAESLEKLERMKITDCKMIEKIIQKVGEEVQKDRIVFKNLQYLKLDQLPSLTSFCLENYTLEFPSLKQVIMSRCPKMKKISQGVLHTVDLQRVELIEGEDDDDDDFDDPSRGQVRCSIGYHMGHNALLGKKIFKAQPPGQPARKHNSSQRTNSSSLQA